MNPIPFNKPFFSGNELKYITEAINYGKISGNGVFTNKCHAFFENKYGFGKCLLTASCTDALEMAAILLDIKPGDEVIVPSYSFVSTANAFALRGATIVFADSTDVSPHVSPESIEQVITKNTKAIIIVHYGGIACDMDKIMSIANKNNLFLVEDCAHSIDSYWQGRPLGSLGDFGTFSFHETKNIISGEGGLLTINRTENIKRSEIIWEKGTNRAAFSRGEVDKYNWIDLGSSYLPSEVTAAFLFAQLESINKIQEKRIRIWNQYYSGLKLLEEKGYFKLPLIPDYATNNGHLFYLLADSLETRNNLIQFLAKSNINAVFHYLPLHQSPFIQKAGSSNELTNVLKFSNQLIRLPLFFEITDLQVDYIIQKITDFYKK
jgi:dTDP-4-amino-4,6-dideoxygalactose transaminase